MLGWIRKAISGEGEIESLLEKARTTDLIDEKAAIYGELADEGIKQALEELAILAYSNRRWAALNAKKLEVWLRKGTKKEVPWCQLVLGWLYEEGLGVSKDPEEALFRYEQAARMDLPEGYYRLGMLLLRGAVSDRRNSLRAARYFRQAEKMGHEKAKNYLDGMEKWDILKREELEGKTENLLDHDLSHTTPWRKGNENLPAELYRGNSYHIKAGDEELLLESRDELLEKAKSGDTRAICRLGVLYLFGEEGFEVNLEKAVECFQAAAADGVVEAQTNLAALYMTGNGVQQDREKAKQLLFYAASQGDGFAMSKLGDICTDGIDGAPDFRQGIHWYQKAVEHQDVNAMIILGVRYLRGIGVGEDLYRAQVLFRMAAERNHPEGINYYAQMLLEKPEPEKQQEGVRWLRENAKHGDAYSMFLLARCYEKGRGIKRDEKEAISWYLFSSRRGFTGAKVELGKLVARDIIKAPSVEDEVEWLQEAITDGDLHASFRLANYYLDGHGEIEPNVKEAIRLFQEGAERSFSESQMVLFHLYEEGKVVERNPEKAAYWAKQALGNGNAEAAYLHGMSLLEKGSEEEGIRNLVFAADQRYSLASDKLGDIFREQGKIEKARFWYEQALEGDDLLKEDILEKIGKLPQELL